MFDTGLRLNELTGINVGDIADKRYLTIVGKGKKRSKIYRKIRNLNYQR